MAIFTEKILSFWLPKNSTWICKWCGYHVWICQLVRLISKLVIFRCPKYLRLYWLDDRIDAKELWLYKNKSALASVSKGLKQAKQMK